jgi:hypothetical protein
MAETTTASLKACHGGSLGAHSGGNLSLSQAGAASRPQKLI